MKLTKIAGLSVLAVMFLTGCLAAPAVKQLAADNGPDTLLIHEDGSMKLNDKPIPHQDVVIYEDGRGGERAAVRVRMEPLHPDFFRDTIVVVRE